MVICCHAYADDIEVPEEELARDTTLPVFSKRRIVLNRNVITTGRFEFGGGVGFELNEPYYNTTMGQFQGTYNLTDLSAVNVQGLYWMSGLSSYGSQLKSTGTTSNPHEYFDAAKAPHPQWGLLVNYEYIAYYGKISISKQTVMNLNTFGLLGVGYINMGSVGDPALNLGVGQNFFFTKNIGMRWNLRWLLFQGPDPTSVRLTQSDNPSPGAFSNRLYFNTQIDLGIVFLL